MDDDAPLPDDAAPSALPDPSDLALFGKDDTPRIVDVVAVRDGADRRRRTARALPPNLWHRQPAADLAGQHVRDFRVTRNGFDLARPGIRPERMASAFPFQVAPIPAQMLQERVLLHAATRTVVRSASSGTPRRPSSRRSSKRSAMASERLSSASARVRP